MDFPVSPPDVPEFEPPQLAVAHARGGRQEEQRAITRACRVSGLDRLDHSTHVLPREHVRDASHGPDRDPRDVPRQVVATDRGPMQIPKKTPQVRHRGGPGSVRGTALTGVEGVRQNVLGREACQ